MTTHTFLLPNLAPSSPASSSEQAFKEVNGAAPADQYVLSLKKQRCISPYGVLMVLHVSRILSERSRNHVEVIDVPDQIHSYLHRVRLFERGASWIKCSQVLKQEWSHTKGSPNVLEITFMEKPKDVIKVVKHAENIFKCWLREEEVAQLTTILSELCSNVCKHSSDSCGCVVAQKYEVPSERCVKVCVCVADLGVGIRGSLSRCHSDLPQKESACLEAALHGLSARGANQVGTGLSQAAEIARKSGGHLILRSHTGRLRIHKTQTVADDDLTPFRGTQLAIEFRAPLAA